MRVLAIAVAIAILAPPFATRARACEPGLRSITTHSVDYSAAKKKKKPASKKKEKVEYMRAVPAK
ncbi:MAG TPA: hypothetical protein VFP60_07875 [Pseudolabrys sp.]|nr:hypothetical protein [Pseudolabrys sp.]